MSSRARMSSGSSRRRKQAASASSNLIDIAAMDEEEEDGNVSVKQEPMDKPQTSVGESGSTGVVRIKTELSSHSPVTQHGFAASTASSAAAVAAATSSNASPASHPRTTAPTYSSLPLRQRGSVNGRRVGRHHRRPQSIVDYLSGLASEALNALYTDSFTCVTIFRSLHPLAKQYVMRMLFITDGVPMSLLDSWVVASIPSRAAHAQAISALTQLHILQRSQGKSDTATTMMEEKSESTAASISTDLIHFNPAFQRCLQHALCSGSLDSSHTLDASVESGDGSEHGIGPSLSELDAFGNDRWESMLHWMVGATSGTGRAPSTVVIERLIRMQLIEPTAASDSAAAAATASTTKPRITPTGFAFLFKDMQTQVWDVVLSYMEGLEGSHADDDGSSMSRMGMDEEMNRDEVLQFLFRLSFLKLGAGYPVTGLTATQQRLLHELHAFGLLYLPPHNADTYYPTRLALNLAAPQVQVGTSAAAAAAAVLPSPSPSSSLPSAAMSGHLIVETTFRVYAYTTSPLHLSLLRLFCRLDARLPNLVVGCITKESIRRALKSNIGSQQIIQYLTAYAHPDMRVNTPCLPDNVVDQIRLWESERNRMHMSDAYLLQFDGNDTAQVIALVRQEAMRRAEQVMLDHPAKRIMVVNAEGYLRIKQFKLQLNAQMVAQGQTATKQV